VRVFSSETNASLKINRLFALALNRIPGADSPQVTGGEFTVFS
jgi:hypothetical protein